VAVIGNWVIGDWRALRGCLLFACDYSLMTDDRRRYDGIFRVDYAADAAA
jgi:hypothetical protein